MNIIRKLFLTMCVIMYLIPAHGQIDTITSDGLYLKYNIPSYRKNEFCVSEATADMIKNKDTQTDTPNDSNMVRGELDITTECIGLTYKALPQYIISEIFNLKDPPANPIELHKTTNRTITSQWTHEDGECILFIKCSGGGPRIDNSINKDGKRTVVMRWSGREPRIDKSIDKLPENIFCWIKHTLGMGSFLKKPTEEQMQEIKKKITIWSPEEAKETFNAQHVITYPIENKKSVYMGKYTHKRELIMIKWGQHLTVSFLVTKKGNKKIDKYIRELEGTFWFED